TRSDAAGSPKVVVVNEAFAKKFGLGREAVGKMMGEGDSLNIQIVGLVKNAHYSNVKQELRPIYYMAYKQDTTVGDLSFYVRSSLPPAALMPQIRHVVQGLDPNLPITELKTMPQQIHDNVYLDR